MENNKFLKSRTVPKYLMVVGLISLSIDAIRLVDHIFHSLETIWTPTEEEEDPKHASSSPTQGPALS